MARTQQSTLIGSFNTLNDTKAFISEGRIVASWDQSSTVQTRPTLSLRAKRSNLAGILRQCMRGFASLRSHDSGKAVTSED